MLSRASVAISIAAVAGLNHTVSDSDYHILLLGDWGGSSDSNPTTSVQNNAAARMGEVAGQLNTQFVLLLGDNFYEDGVKDTKRFQAGFEDCFHQDSLSNIPFYAIAGNHDHHQSLDPQISYTGQGTGRWQMPSLNYNIDKTLPDGKKLRIVMFDSVELVGQSYIDKNDEVIAPTGPSNYGAAKANWDWIEKSLKESDADYLFTAGHYPVHSGCRHGSVLKNSDLPGLLSKYGANGHFAGHDHCLIHIEEGNQAHVLSGAGSDNWYTYKASLVSGATIKFAIHDGNYGNHDGGFAGISFSAEGATVRYYSNNGAVLYTSSPIAPRPPPTIRAPAELTV